MEAFFNKQDPNIYYKTMQKAMKAFGHFPESISQPYDYQ